MFLFTRLRKFFAPTIDEEYERGTRDALRFLETRPTLVQINQYWSSACEDADFSYGPAKAYADAVKEVIRPHRRPI